MSVCLNECENVYMSVSVYDWWVLYDCVNMFTIFFWVCMIVCPAIIMYEYDLSMIVRSWWQVFCIMYWYMNINECMCGLLFVYVWQYPISLWKIEYTIDRLMDNFKNQEWESFTSKEEFRLVIYKNFIEI